MKLFHDGYTPQARLAKYRERAATSKYGQDWRQCRWGAGGKVYPLHRSADGRRILADNLDQFGTVEGPAYKLTAGGYSHGSDVVGYYCDPVHEFDAIQPQVVRVRTARGTMYIPAADFSDQDGAIFWPQNAEIAPKGGDEYAHENARRAAAWEADRLCRDYAENEREVRIPEAAAMDAEHLRDMAGNARTEARAMLAELRTIKSTVTPEAAPKLCAALRDDIRGLLMAARDNYATARRYTADPDTWYHDTMGRMY